MKKYFNERQAKPLTEDIVSEIAQEVGEEIDTKIAVLDLETDPFEDQEKGIPAVDQILPFVGGFYDGKDLEIFWGNPTKGDPWGDCIPRLVARLKKCKPGTIVYAHNGGNFDFHFLLEYLPVNDCDFLCMGKRIVQIKLPWGVELRDSFAIIPKKLAAYKKDEIDYKKFIRKLREKYKGEIIPYLKTDLRENRNMVVGFLKRFPAKLTLASSVFEMMKKRFDYNPGRSDAVFDGQYRPFFFGGRVQFWKLGKLDGEFKIIDINSAYPWGMTQNHWFGFSGKAHSKMPKKNFEQSFFVLECESKGAFPKREKTGGVGFPVGFGKFFVTGWELKAAMDLKLVSNIRILICYEPDEIKSMKEFSQTLYDKKNAAKMAGDKEEEFFNKIAVNAGYGKLALNVSRFSEVKVTDLFEKPDYREGNKKDGKVISEKKAKAEGQGIWKNCWDDPDRGLSFWKRKSYREGIDKFINVATAASITGCVRAFLLRSMHACKDVVYCDTDSIIARDVSKMKMGDKLGEWKLEMKTEKLFIAGKKLYAAFGVTDKGEKKWKKACKGVNLSPEKICAVALGKKESHKSNAPTYSLFSAPKFVSRDIVRADKREEQKEFKRKENKEKALKLKMQKNGKSALQRKK